MELAALDDEDPKSLRRLARKLLENASTGENTLAAIKEVADRLDGRPATIIENGEDGAFELLHRIERVIVRPPDSNG